MPCQTKRNSLSRRLFRERETSRWSHSLEYLSAKGSLGTHLHISNQFPDWRHESSFCCGDDLEGWVSLGMDEVHTNQLSNHMERLGWSLSIWQYNLWPVWRMQMISHKQRLGPYQMLNCLSLWSWTYQVIRSLRNKLFISYLVYGIVPKLDYWIKTVMSPA